MAIGAEALAALRYSHVVVACAGLCLFWLPVVARKGGRVHVACGRLFASCAFYAGATGLILSIWALVHPTSFFGEAPTQRLDDEQAAVAHGYSRFLYSITGFLALTVLAGTALGLSVARARTSHERLTSPALLAILGAHGLWSLALLLYGVGNAVVSLAGWSPSPDATSGRFVLSAVLGVIGVSGAIGDLRFVMRPPITPMAWRYRHMECMLGAGVGFHAAAFFFITKEFLDIRLPGAWQLAPMLLPVAIGIPAIWLWVAREERRLEPQDPG